MQEVYYFISRVAATCATVLLEGESGTGKELVARAIHQNSLRSGQPFIAINCAALPENLLESELFGHTKGAFTGAVTDKKGKMELADSGTLFLDEIGELPLGLQAKLLRALQEREVDRVGGARPVRIDARVITATNADLRAAVDRGAFRADLYFRLNVISVRMPPLRERREDIPMLATFFAAECGKRAGRKVAGLSSDALDLLLRYDWPGNVRELQNAIERAMVMGSSELILPEDLPETLTAPEEIDIAVGSTTYKKAVRAFKKQLILNAIRGSGGSKTEAARLLGVRPNYLHRLISVLGLQQVLREP